jgi:hypothetical protein
VDEALVVRWDNGGRGRVRGDGRDQRFGGGNAAGQRNHPRHEGTALHVFMREAVVEGDGLLPDVFTHAVCSCFACASAISLPSISRARR